VTEIDAEVVRLDTEVEPDGSMTRDGLRRAVIEHERRAFCERLQIERVLGECELRVSATGRYDEIQSHIVGHKYFINETNTVEIPLETAIKSWYENVYCPIVLVIREYRLMHRFPGRTETDLYLWVVRHWDILKRRYGQDVPIEAAARDYSRAFGVSWWRRLLTRLGILRDDSSSR
jgi:hypothetical protein